MRHGQRTTLWITWTRGTMYTGPSCLLDIAMMVQLPEAFPRGFLCCSLITGRNYPPCFSLREKTNDSATLYGGGLETRASQLIVGYKLSKMQRRAAQMAGANFAPLLSRQMGSSRNLTRRAKTDAMSAVELIR